MKAMLYYEYGGPDVIQLRKMQKPSPKKSEVLIKIHATTVTAAEGMMRRGDTFMSRMILGLWKPRKKYRILGLELSGEIESIGDDVQRFKEGDEVYGFTGFTLGAYAEYKCMPEKGSLVLKPNKMEHAEAASLVDGATTAICFLKDKANIQAGQKVLINGASGSIGTYAVQIAKYLGAEVTAVCSSRNIELVKSLGADHAIDYTTEDFTKNRDFYDVIFDAVGKTSFSRSKGSLNRNGKYLVTTGNMFNLYFLTLWTSLTGGKRFVYTMSVDKTNSLHYINELIEVGKIKPVIDKYYPLEQVAQAHRYVERGHKKGNVVIIVNP